MSEPKAREAIFFIDDQFNSGRPIASIPKNHWKIILREREAREKDFSEANTEVVVLGAGYGKRWIYEKRKLGPLINAAITEMAALIRDNIVPVRFGWWCKICTFRGICTGLMK